MPARSDMYRRFAIQAKQQHSRASDSEVRRGFADIADHWAIEPSCVMSKIELPHYTGNQM